MTDERLAELDAVMAMLGKAPLWKTGQWFERNAADIRAHIDAQDATIARQAEALREIVGLVVEAIDLERIGAVVALDAIADVAHATLKGAA